MRVHVKHAEQQVKAIAEPEQAIVEITGEAPFGAVLLVIPDRAQSCDIGRRVVEIRRSVDPHFAIAEHQGRTRTVDRPEFADRSEEHTSELQSLMRISYAVFCLKKKKIKTTT